MTKWLDERNLKQEYCGLISIPNMPNCFGVYYDWGKHIHDNGIKSCDLSLYKIGTNQEQKFYETYQNNTGLLDTIPDPIGYRGIIKNTEFVQGDDVRGSSIVKDVKPIVIMTYMLKLQEIITALRRLFQKLQHSHKWVLFFCRFIGRFNL